MAALLFDPAARDLRRARASRGEPFLLARAFDECAERLLTIGRPVAELLVAGPIPLAWDERFEGIRVTHCPLTDEQDAAALPAGQFDAVITVGALETIDDVPLVLQLLGRALKPDSPLIGALIGGDSFPALRRAVIEADRDTAGATPRMHPRIDAASLAGLLSAAGLVMPVVDVDRLEIRYRSLGRLVGDLRQAGFSNQLAGRSKAYAGKAWRERIEQRFAATAIDGRVAEQVDYLNFLAWSPA